MASRTNGGSSAPYRARFDRTLKRLLPETFNVMACQATLEALPGIRVGGSLLSTAFSALKSDRLIRLIRIFEDSKNTSNFWYLLRCEPGNVGKGLDVAFLKQFSKKLKHIRDNTFVHIDKDAVFDPDAIYKAAGLTPNEMIRAMEMLWTVLNRLYKERFASSFSKIGDTSLAGFREIAQRNRATLLLRLK
jgi:hypothetical protein